MAKQPFLPLFFGDFLASTAEWAGEERALYLLILGHAWAAGSVPADPERLRRLLGYDKGTFGSAWPQVSTKFVTSDGRLFNERLSRLGLAGTGRDSQAGPRPPRSSDPKP